MPSSSALLTRDPLAIVVSIERAAQVIESDLALAGDLMRSVILDKTARGVDVDGNAFAPYAPSYAKKRTKSGRTAAPVNLLWSGRMLQSLRVVTSVALNEVALVIYGAGAVRAEAHNLSGRHLPQRHWHADAVQLTQTQSVGTAPATPSATVRSLNPHSRNRFAATPIIIPTNSSTCCRSRAVIGPFRTFVPPSSAGSS